MSGVRVRSAQTTVLCIALAVLVAIVLATHLSLRAAREREVRAVLAANETAAHKLAARTAEVFDRMTETAGVVAFLKSQPAPPRLQELQRAGILAREMATSVYVADSRGFVVDSTGAEVALNVADEDHFKAHLREPGLRSLIAPVARHPVDWRPGIPVTHRLSRAGGFDGVVVATIDPATLTHGAGRLEQRGTVVAVLGQDGLFRARTLDGRLTFGGHLDRRKASQLAEQVRRTLQPVASPVDGVPRFVSVLPVRGYPLFVVVAPQAQQALSAYHEVEDRTVLQALGLCALTVVGALLALAQARRLDLSRARVRHAESVFRATLDGSPDAVAILRPLRDAQGRLVDMVVEDCNVVAGQYLGVDRRHLLGQPLSEAVPTIVSRGFLASFEQVMTSGQALHAELENLELHRLGRWMHHQVVPIDDGVALISRDVTEQREARAQLERLTRVDSLTGLANRRGHEAALDAARARADRSRGTLAVIYLDLDGFKQINDSHGHGVGDEVLVEVGRRLKSELRTTDIVARLGGDEFSVVAENAGTEADVRDLCERLLVRLSQPHRIGGLHLVVTPSIGCAVRRPQEPAASLLQRADLAMYEAKRSGKACYHLDPLAVLPLVPTPHLAAA